MPAPTAPAPSASRGLKGRDLITVGIFSAIYFVLQFVPMLIGGLHPLLWVFMPAVDALITGIPFMLLAAKVQKSGAVFIMGMITAVIYFATGMFTPLIVATAAAACLVAELVRRATGFSSFKGNALAFACFGFGMCGSPLAVWVYRDAFLEQITSMGTSAEYAAALDALASMPMLVAMLAATFVAGLVGALIARALFRKHFEKAGLV